MSEETFPTYRRIYTHMTKSTWLHVEDALDLVIHGQPKPKLRFFAGRYQKGEGSKQTAFHFIDVNDARPLLQDMSWGKKLDWTDYKGVTNGGSTPATISRVLRINTSGDGKVYFEFKTGPGKASDTGAVMPAWKQGEETTVNVMLGPEDARKLACSLIEQLIAWSVAIRLTRPHQPGPEPDVPAEEAAGDELTTEDVMDLLFPLEEQKTADGGRAYHNGEPVGDDMLEAYEKFRRAMRVAPFSRDKLAAWVASNGRA